MNLDKLEAAMKAAQRPGETFHAGAEFDALLREHAAEVIAMAKEKSAAVDAAHHWHHRAKRLEEAIQDFADSFPGNSDMWQSVQLFAKRALK